MKIHDALSELGFSLVVKAATSGHYRHHHASASVVVPAPVGVNPQVIISGARFAGVKTVGDVRHLLRLWGVTVPGVPNPCPADDHERDRDEKSQAKWAGWDAMPLVYDYAKEGR